MSGKCIINHNVHTDQPEHCNPVNPPNILYCRTAKKSILYLINELPIPHMSESVHKVFCWFPQDGSVALETCQQFMQLIFFGVSGTIHHFWSFRNRNVSLNYSSCSKPPSSKSKQAGSVRGESGNPVISRRRHLCGRHERKMRDPVTTQTRERWRHD